MGSLSLSFSQTQRHKPLQRLSVAQRHEIKQEMLMNRLGLIGEVHGGNYRPSARCPGCYRDLIPLEIIQGFSTDPMDYTTRCTKCNKRFEPKLVWYSSDAVKLELSFYCDVQVLAQLRGLEQMTPDQIRQQSPAIYHSVRVHHGNFRRAFAKIEIQYAYEDVPGWQEKIQSYLGKLPDTVIAEVVDVSVRKIRQLRVAAGISMFRRRDLLLED